MCMYVMNIYLSLSVRIQSFCHWVWGTFIFFNQVWGGAAPKSLRNNGLKNKYFEEH
jgi:hypothetical protein